MSDNGLTPADMIVNEAWRAFDAWLSEQTDEIQELSLLEQIDKYAEANNSGPCINSR